VTKPPKYELIQKAESLRRAIVDAIEAVENERDRQILRCAERDAGHALTDLESL